MSPSLQIRTTNRTDVATGKDIRHPCQRMWRGFIQRWRKRETSLKRRRRRKNVELEKMNPGIFA